MAFQPATSSSSSFRRQPHKGWKYTSLANVSNASYSLGRGYLRWVMLLFGSGFIFFFLLISFFSTDNNSSQLQADQVQLCEPLTSAVPFNRTYPLSKPLKSKNFLRYKIALIADLDKTSKRFSKDFWASYMLEGYLFYYPSTKRVDVRFQNEDQTLLKGTFSVRKRGMELSELIVFNANLLTCDDRTGIVYRLIQHDSQTTEPDLSSESSDKSTITTNTAGLSINSTSESAVRRRLSEMGGMLNFSEQTENKRPYKLIPWLVLMDGDGLQEKPFKCEWMAVKDEQLYVGGLGKEWTTPTGEYVNNHPQWIKKINAQGVITHLDWTNHYKMLANSIGIQSPGYVIHESAAYSHHLKSWIFLPRKASLLQYNEQEDEEHGTNYFIQANADFTNVTYKKVGNLNPLHGFSSFKFVPDTDDQVLIAIKSMEFKDKVSTFIMAFDIEGNVLMEERLVNNEMKFEGIEFV